MKSAPVQWVCGSWHSRKVALPIPKPPLDSVVDAINEQVALAVDRTLRQIITQAIEEGIQLQRDAIDGPDGINADEEITVRTRIPTKQL